MKNDEPMQPKDYVSESSDIHDTVRRTVGALESPSSILLFVFLIVLILVAGDWIQTYFQTGVLRDWLKEIEGGRHDELMACQNITKDLVTLCLGK